MSKQNLTPSTSYGYLAGASYYSFPRNGYASLTFGGYDTTRLDITKNLTLAAGSDEYRPILLSVESITAKGQSLLSSPITVSLDTLVSQIWLPVTACALFEQAFGLKWNETYGLYLLSDSQYQSLLASNASITFELSNGQRNSTQRLNITLPYSAFDLQVKAPIVGNETLRYFPLKQATNDSQYTLGRTIMQEIYMIADYDRGNITLYQGLYPDSSVSPQIKTICAPNSASCEPQNNASKKSSNSGMIAGIAVGAAGGLAIVGLVIWWLRRRRRQEREREAMSKDASIRSPLSPSSHVASAAAGFTPIDKPEMADTQVSHHRAEVQGSPAYPHDVKPELDGSGLASPTSAATSNYSSTRKQVSPLSRQTFSEADGTERVELAGEVRTPELEGSPRIHELYGSERFHDRTP